MREINKTLYEIVNQPEPNDEMNVSQIITDDLIAKQKSGEASAKAGASKLLDKKADAIHGPREKKVLKATGTSQIKVAAGGGPPPVTKPTGTTTKKVVKKKVTTSKTATRKIQTNKKPASNSAEKKSSLMPILLLIVLGAAGAYYYFNMMQ